MADTTPTPPIAPDPNAPATSAPPDDKPATDKPQAKRTAAPAKAPKVTYYKVLHGAVGQWAQDTVISSDDLAGVDVGRLLKLGALSVTDAPEEDAPADE